MSTANNVLQPVTTRGWLRGFANLLDRERHLWLGTRKGLVQVLVWILLINGSVALMGIISMNLDKIAPDQAGAVPATPEDMYEGVLQAFFQLATFCTSVGVVISAHGTIIQEKQMGTAAWILSKPVSRSAFLVAKLAAHSISYLLLAILIPIVMLYPECYLLTGRIPALPGLLAGMGVWLLVVLFYLALTIMLGVFFNSRGAMLGIVFGFMFAGQILPNLWPDSALIFPWVLSSIALLLALGSDAPQALSPVMMMPVIATALWIMLFTALAIWRFGREEF